MKQNAKYYFKGQPTNKKKPSLQHTTYKVIRGWPIWKHILSYAYEFHHSKSNWGVITFKYLDI